MKNTSRVLGIIGGVIAILFGLFLALGGTVFMDTSKWESLYIASAGMSDVVTKSQYLDQTRAAGIAFIGFGIASCIAGALGLIGGIIVKKKNVVSGVMMIIAAVISLLVFFNIISMILFILGGTFALMKEPQNVMQPYPSQYPQPSPSPENPTQK